jgi:hypothetical protein
VSTQLRLVESIEVRPQRGDTAAARAKIGPRGTGTRRAIDWGGWRLDDRTRRIGRAGVAAAREALVAAREARELREAS